MAAQTDRHIRYQNIQVVQILKSEPLGAGFYGAVYRAKYDQLPCAAKLLHPILTDQGAPRSHQYFEQESQFLSGIRHPHIVQYLGICRDPDSGLPVLLMELMDDSLTHFLEQSQDQLPYHLEVNFCHDVALALAYLHSNGIIHRDLSSNNVLLIAVSRAKVSDFGMSKLIEATPQMTPLKQCPEAVVYMSPEVVREPPKYTDKVDCFAHGVVAIQIMTRKFPDPGPPTQLINDPQSPTGTMLLSVLEHKRRKSHIDCIHPSHPLLPIAIRCLGYHEKDRPSAQQLCNQLDALKKSPQYIQSMQQARDKVNSQQGDQDLRQELKQATHDIQHQEKNIAELQEQLHTAALTNKEEIQRLTRDTHQLISDNQQLRQVVRDKNDQIEEKKEQLRNKEHIIAEFQQTLAQKDKRIRNLEECISTKERDIQEQSQPKPKLGKSQTSNTAVDTIKLNWRQRTKAPCGMIRGSAAVDGSTAYFRPEFCSTVHAYDSEKEVWTQMPDCPQNAFTLAIVKGLLTAVGGEQLGKPINTLLSFIKGKWSKHFPPMPTKRYESSAVCTGRSLVVAGGWGGSGRGYGDSRTARLNRVEVMDTDTLQWFTASSLPYALTRASATICGENLYLLGGWDQSGPTKSVFTCTLSALLQSCIQSPGARPRSLSQEPEVWQKVAPIPVNLSTCTALCGHLLAAGGFHSDYKPSTAIKKYDPVKNSWTVISRMSTLRYLTLVAVLPGNRLMVVGGNTLASGGFSICDTIEIATVS